MVNVEACDADGSVASPAALGVESRGTELRTAALAIGALVADGIGALTADDVGLLGFVEACAEGGWWVGAIGAGDAVGTAAPGAVGAETVGGGAFGSCIGPALGCQATAGGGAQWGTCGGDPPPPALA